MMQYEFTLITDRTATDEQADALFDIDQGDSIPEGGATGPALVHVHRVAPSLLEAIASAVPDVESVGLVVEGVQSEDLVSLKDIAARMGRSYESVRKLANGERGKGGFPAPVSPSNWNLYSWSLVAEWFGEPAKPFAREIAAADYALRARRMMPAREPARRHQLATLVDA